MMKSENRRMNYADLTTKMAAQRTFMLLLVSTKVFILLAASKHSKMGVIFGVTLLCIVGLQYYFNIREINKKNYIDNVFFDYYLLILLPVLLYMSYLSWKHRKS